MIPLEERQHCTRATQNALAHFAARDLESLLSDLRELEKTFVYSNYAFYREWEDTKPHIVRFLFESLPFEEFLQFPAGCNFYKFETIKWLDELAPQISVPQIQQLCETYKFPRQSSSPLLFQKLVEAPEPQVTDWLQEHIESFIEKRRDELARDVPIDSDELALRIAILARRTDLKALELCREYGRNLPWEDKSRFNVYRTRIIAHGSTAALFDGMGTQKSAAAQEIMLDWLEFHQSLDILRLNLLGNLRHVDVRQAFEKACVDLNGKMEAETRESYIQWISANSEEFAPLIQDSKPTLDFSKWSPVSRAMLFVRAKEKFPGWEIPLSWREKLIFATVALFEKLRWNNDHLLPSLVTCIGVSMVYLVALSWLLHGPTDKFLWKEAIPFISFIDLILLLVMCVNGMNTSKWWGSTHDWTRQKWDAAIAFFGCRLAFLVGAIVVRMI